MINRRTALFASLAAGAGAAALAGLTPALRAQDSLPDPEEVHFDPDAPVMGNPDGDVTIVEYFDYQCPYCKTNHPALLDLVERDGGVRLLMRDWPIFGPASIRATQLVLGAAAFGAYEPTHLALMATAGRLRPEDVDAVLTKAGIDVAAAGAAFDDAHARWSGYLTRNAGQAEAFGLPGTRGFVIGSAIHRGAVSEAQLTAAVAAARG
jgi:protein-disulfide isomerase